MAGQQGEVTAATTLVYSKAALSASLLERFANARSRRSLSPFARGLTSFVYRITDEASGDDDETVYCLKRVVEEDEMAPHSVQREILCYQTIDEEQRRRNCSVQIASLLAAFRDESDPFSVEIDLIMPFYPCTLEEIMDEPLLQLHSSDENDIRTTQPRPSLSIAQQVQATSLDSFITSTTRDLFSALSFLHSCQIAHRDIKPSNILVDPKTLSIVLIDFGTCHLPSYIPGDDRIGGMTSEVGTGAYRAPECLFSPLNGYSPEKVDIWQAGVTLIQFFLPLRKVEVTKVKSRIASELEDERQEWEKALWADDGGVSWSQLDTTKYTDTSQIEDEKESSASGWKRNTLFEASRGDLGLANSIFELRGLPSSTFEWPEAEHFQPSLQRMPFARRPPAPGGLRQRLSSSSLSNIIDILDQCIQLSPSKRMSADDIIKQL
jgi:serine/threonine protein kinase